MSRVALENRGHPDNNNLKLPLFDIADLLCFENIKTLELEGFNVRNENIMDEDQDDYKMESRKPMHKQAEITNLKLKNCIWEYPFTVQDFGPIKNLQVVYTDCYRSFTCKHTPSTLHPYRSEIKDHRFFALSRFNAV